MENLFSSFNFQLKFEVFYKVFPRVWVSEERESIKNVEQKLYKIKELKKLN